MSSWRLHEPSTHLVMFVNRGEAAAMSGFTPWEWLVDVVEVRPPPGQDMSWRFYRWVSTVADCGGGWCG